jgi:hypothetical protein
MLLLKAEARRFARPAWHPSPWGARFPRWCRKILPRPRRTVGGEKAATGAIQGGTGARAPRGRFSRCSSSWCRSPLGYEPYDVHLCRLARSPVAAMTLAPGWCMPASRPWRPPSHCGAPRLVHRSVHKSGSWPAASSTPSRRATATSRFFRPAIFLSWRGSCERYALPLAAAGSRWLLLLLLSPLLSAADPVPHLQGLPGAVTVLCPAQPPPPNPTAAEPDGSRVRGGHPHVHPMLAARRNLHTVSARSPQQSHLPGADCC